MLRGPASSTGEWNSTLGAAGFAPGAMTSSTTPNPWQPYFGEPIREIKLNPYAAYGRENYALPDAYQGSVPYMTQLMIHIIKDEDLWPTKVVCPIRITESEMEVAWDEIIFNDHMLQPVPEEGISRLVTQQTNERRDHYVRYGIALILEHGFMKTAKGQQSYQMNILQIRNATLETMYFGVIEALLNSKQYSQAWTRKYGTMARSGAALRGYLGDEVERYMIVQKTEHGFDMLDNKAKKYLRSNGITPDTWILPEGTATFLQTVRPENRDYYLKGPEGPAGYKTALNDAPYGGVRQIAANSCAVYESKSFEVPGAPAPVDPLTREVSVGEYVTMVDTVSDVVGCGDYKSHMRDIFVYDERRDDFSKITLRNALKACCRFDDSGALWFPPGWTPPSSGETDPFMVPDNSGRIVYTFGDMDTAYMPDEIVQKVADSLVCKYWQMKNNKSESCKDDDCEDPEKWAECEELVGDFPTVDGQPAAAAAEFLPGDFRRVLPAGFGASKAVSGKKLLKSALQPWYEFLKQRLPSCRLFQKEYIPSWRKAEGEMGGLFYNTIGKLSTSKRARSASYSKVGTSSLAEAEAFFKTDTDAAITSTGVINWDLVRAKFAALVSSDGSAPPSPSEAALTASTIDKFILKMTLLGGSADSYDAVLQTLCALGLAIQAFKGHAKDFLKHYQFVVHKGLLAIADVHVESGYSAINATIENFIGIIRPSAHYAAFQKGVADVQAVFTAASIPAASASASAETIPGPTYPIIGAFDVPALNAHFGGMDMDDYGPPKQRMRFGAYPSQVEGTRRGPGGAGFDSEFPSSIDPTKLPPYSKQMDTRYKDIRTDPSYKVLVKSAMLAFLHTPITYDTLSTLIDKDVYYPFEFVLFRPRITHQMATGILMKAGAETGETLVGHADFQLTDDVVRKMHYGHFTLYSKTIVWKSDNIYLAENIVATGYVRGNDTSFNTLDSLYTASGESTARSIYCAMVPVSTRTTEDTVQSGVGYFNPMDITGHFAQSVPHLRNLDLEVGNPGREHYPGASFYASVWRMNNTSAKLDGDYTPLQLGAHNTLCFQGHQFSYNPASRAYDLATLNTGHFGSRIYPGCGQVRRMANAKYLMPVNYTSAFGAQSQMVTLGA